MAEYDIGGSKWLQFAAELLYPKEPDSAAVELWTSRFRTLTRGLETVPQASASLRVHLTDGLRTALIAVAPSVQSTIFRRVAGSFTQLDASTRGEVRYPQKRIEHDRILAFPQYRCRVVLPYLSIGPAWFAFDFRILPVFDELLAEARSLRHQLSYHLNLEPVRIEAEWQRQAARNALAIGDLPGIPAGIYNLQTRLSEKIRDATHLCEEFLGVDTVPARDWLVGVLERRFAAAFGRYVTPEFRFESDEYEASLTVARHTSFFDQPSADELCSTAISSDERLRMLSWFPAREIIDMVPEISSQVEDASDAQPSDYAAMPTSYSGREPYLFISYKREDLPQVAPLASEINRTGFRIWYDKGIPGGSEWDEVIEERIRNCELLVLFLSTRAAYSKYVRREVKFADALNKRIVAVRLEPRIDLPYGMAMLLNQYQVLEGSPAHIGLEFQRVRSASSH